MLTERYINGLVKFGSILPIPGIILTEELTFTPILSMFVKQMKYNLQYFQIQVQTISISLLKESLKQQFQ